MTVTMLRPGQSDAGPIGQQTRRSQPLVDRLCQTRQWSLRLASPLSAEDMLAQAMDDASPTKWHLAHVTWFFETFVLTKYLDGYPIFDNDFNYCFNSYYESQGARQPRPQRGLLTRPSLDAVLRYREHVDDGLAKLCRSGVDEQSDLGKLIELGINHEQQHQELLLTDILALFAANPLKPAYQQPSAASAMTAADSMTWLTFDGGIESIGHDGKSFCWDNECPKHDALVHPFRFADRLVNSGEWLDFIADGGYSNPLLWLADGWGWVNREGVTSPLYWEQHDDEWRHMTLEGLVAIDRAAPVDHVSYYEAEAFARWAGARLPTEFEWEFVSRRTAATTAEVGDNGMMQVRPSSPPPAQSGGARQMYGATWQWTQSAYLPYPGYRPPAGAIGEYNGKFMVSQHVLRGSSIATPPGHSRPTYRNFFYPHQRWQFTGLRLAAEAK